MSAPFFLPESLSDNDAMVGDIPPIPADPGSDQFKTVHGWFRSREAVEAAIAEHSEFGWALYEVIDNFRIRFRRTAQAAAKDVARIGNPYATTCRRQNVGPAFLMILGFPALVAAAFVLVFVLKQSNRTPAPPQMTRHAAASHAEGTAKVLDVNAHQVVTVPAMPVPPAAPRDAKVIFTRSR